MAVCAQQFFGLWGKQCSLDLKVPFPVTMCFKGADTSSFLCLCKPHWTVAFCNQKIEVSGWSLQDLHLLVVIVFHENVLLPSRKQKWKWDLCDIASLQQGGCITWSFVLLSTFDCCWRLSQHVAPPTPLGTHLMGMTFPASPGTPAVSPPVGRAALGPSEQTPRLLPLYSFQKA